MKPKLYRRRYIPDELLCLEKDELLYDENDIIITKWRSLQPRKDFSHGISCYYLADGIKVSRFYTDDNKLLYHYCDVIEICYDNKDNSYIFNDLLLDVIVCNDGSTRVLDLDELAEALDKNLITSAQASAALTSCSRLLEIIYSGQFGKYTSIIDEQLSRTGYYNGSS